MSRQLPSVGRVVHYRSYGTPGGEYTSLARAAVITEVDEPGNPESSVGLCILNPTGQFFTRNVKFSDAPGGWSWPPYVAPVD
jgi:hypothetical protein